MQNSPSAHEAAPNNDFGTFGQTVTDFHIPADLLKQWAAPDNDALRGEFDAETRAMLAMALPEICRELLQHRQAAEIRSERHRIDLMRKRICRARMAIRAPQSVQRDILASACETILQHSTDSAERAIATTLLTQTRETA